MNEIVAELRRESEQQIGQGPKRGTLPRFVPTVDQVQAAVAAAQIENAIGERAAGQQAQFQKSHPAPPWFASR